MNIATSIRSKLKNIARTENIAFQLLIFRYLHERLLYRLSVSNYRQCFYLKGGTLLYAIEGKKARPTKDIDFSGKGLINNELEIKQIFSNICSIDFPTDGVFFDINGITTEIINESGDYQGIRLYINTRFDTILQRLQIDIGFGDKLTPSSNEILFPTLLSDMDKPLIKCYSVENIIAEKFQAMIAFSTTNSRMKDFYDIYILLKSNNYNNEILHEAIIATFKNRNTSFVVDHDLFTDEFFKDEQRLKMWKSFLIKIKEEKNLSFYEIMILIKEKLYPIWQNL